MGPFALSCTVVHVVAVVRQVVHAADIQARLHRTCMCAAARYNRGITIKQNKFVVFDEGRFLLKAKFVDGLAWTGNTVRPYTGATRAHAHSHARPHAYTKRPGALPRVSVEFSNSVCIDAKCANGTATGGGGNSA